MNHLPIVALIGRPNVGKSSLFNQLTKTRSALVADSPGLTRDRQYGLAYYQDRPYGLIDTGGLLDNDPFFNAAIARQTWQAVDESDLVVFMVDAKDGLTTTDRLIAQALRAKSFNDRLVLVINKVDGLSADKASFEFFELGFSQPVLISAAHARGLDALQACFMAHFSVEKMPEEDPETGCSSHVETNPPSTLCIAKQGLVKLALIGRPNVGKSTLINRWLGEERVIVSEKPGTTRDSIEIFFSRKQRSYCLIDTAGLRRRSRIDDRIEKFSIVKTLQAVEAADLVLVVMNAQEGLTDQDLHLIRLVIDSGRGLGLLFNQWDGLSNTQKSDLKQVCEHRLMFADFAPMHYISALHGNGVAAVWQSVEAIYQSITKAMPTPELNRILMRAVADNPPPRVKHRRVKLRYTHLGGLKPPCIVIHGQQTEHLPEPYQRYLKHAFQKAYSLVGTPIRLKFHNTDNPFEGRRETLTPRQKRTQHQRASKIASKQRSLKKHAVRDKNLK